MSARAKVQLRIAPPAPVKAPAAPAVRGYSVAYRPHEPNRCPGCGRSNWLVGRTMAECGFCATALPIVADGRLPFDEVPNP